MVEQGCREGWLPNIDTRFYKGGARVRHAVTCVPPVTYAAIATILTGAGPGQHQIIGNRWFDPDEALFRDYATIRHYRDVNADFDAPTVYERIQPATSVSIQSAHRRGVTKNIANWALSGVDWFFHNYTAVDKLTASSIWRVAWWANEHGQWPSVLMCYFPGVDSIGHAWGPSSPVFRSAMEHADYQVGRVCDWLEAKGLLETTYVVLLSDHGMVDVEPEGHIDLLSLVRDAWGRSATRLALQENTRSERLSYYDQFDTVVNDQDGRRASLHFRDSNGWDHRAACADVETILLAPPPDARLWNIEGVDLVIYLAAHDEAVLRSRAGEARIRRRATPTGPEYEYVPEPVDVLGYLGEPALSEFVAAGFHPSRDWLAATASQTRPDVVPHLISLLHVRRAGQVVLFAEPGYSFVKESGGHGGVHRDEMLMTVLITGPGIEPGSVVEVARSVDLVPTILDWLDIEADDEGCLEGVSLLNAGLRCGETARAEGR